MSRYTEGIASDGAAILKDGQPITISEILSSLNELESMRDRVEQEICGDCLDGSPDEYPDTYGWNYNAVEGWHECGCIGESGPYQKLTKRIDELKRGAKITSQCLNNSIVAIQSAFIAGMADGPEEAMVWLRNYLAGPGLIPSDEDMNGGAQAHSDKHTKY